MALLKIIITRCLISMIRLYQVLLSGLFGPCGCRFYPTCSNYALDAFKAHGCFRGFYLTIRRLLRCHPWHPGGADPIP